MLGKKTPRCIKCSGTGWLRVADPVARRIYQDKTATALLRCDCRQGEKYWQHEKQLEPWKPAQIKAPQTKRPQ